MLSWSPTTAALVGMQRAFRLFHEHKELTPQADYKLGTLGQYFVVPLRPKDAHDAPADVRTTVKLYRAMVGGGGYARALTPTQCEIDTWQEELCR